MNKKPNYQFSNLRIINLVLGLLYLVQAMVIFLASNNFSNKVTTSFLKSVSDSSIVYSATETLINLRIGSILALVMQVSALAYLLMCAPGLFEWHKQYLKRKLNYVKWFDFAITYSLLVIVIAGFIGMYDAGSLVLLFFTNFAAIIFMLIAEITNSSKEKISKKEFRGFYFCILFSLVSWLILTWYLLSAHYASADVSIVPQYVIFVFVTIAILFVFSLVTLIVNIKKIWFYKKYIFGEKVFSIVTFVLKALIVWQIFIAVLR